VGNSSRNGDRAKIDLARRSKRDGERTAGWQAHAHKQSPGRSQHTHTCEWRSTGDLRKRIPIGGSGTGRACRTGGLLLARTGSDHGVPLGNRRAATPAEANRGRKGRSARLSFHFSFGFGLLALLIGSVTLWYLVSGVRSRSRRRSLSAKKAGQIRRDCGLSSVSHSNASRSVRESVSESKKKKHQSPRTQTENRSSIGSSPTYIFIYIFLRVLCCKCPRRRTAGKRSIYRSAIWINARILGTQTRHKQRGSRADPGQLYFSTIMRCVYYF